MTGTLTRTALERFIILVVLFLSVFSPHVASAETGGEQSSSPDCSIPEIIKVTRPRTDGNIIPVKIGFFLIDIKNIKDVDQTYKADVFFNVSWTDPRLSENSLGRSLEDCKFTLNDLWRPPVLVVNRNKGDKLLDVAATVDSDGHVNYKQRFMGEFTSDLDFKDFPFDRQVLHFIITAYGPDAEEIVFEADDNYTGTRERFSIEGWSVALLDSVSTYETITTLNQGSDREFARIDFRLSAKREKNYYLWKVITPLCFIVLMAWAVFWIDPSHFGPQVGLSTATVFTLIAYRFSLGFSLPKVSYFTRVDKFVLFSTVLVFLALGAAIATSKITSDGNKKLAQQIEYWARYVYLIIFLFIIVFTLWL